MALIPVILEVKDYAQREVMEVHYEFDKALDDEGQVVGIPRGGKMYFKVKALNDGNSELLQWMLERNLAKDFTVSFNETKTGKLMKKYEATGAYCVEYHEHEADKEAHYEEFTVTCQNIKFSKASYENAWK